MRRRAGSCLLILSVVVAALALPAGAVTNATQRYEGPNRYDTAVAVSTHSFGFPPVHALYLASGEAFADALAGGPAAVERGPGPLLLTPRTTLPSSVAAEIDRLNPERVYVLGGEQAIAPAVADQVATRHPVTRIGGANRYGTAAAVALDAFPGGAPTVVIATGEDFPDALSGSAAGAARHWPVLLTRRDALPTETAAALDRLHPARAVVVGQSDVVSTAVEAELRRHVATVDRVGGDDRYATSAAVVAYAFPSHTTSAFVATGLDYPDALAGAPAAGARGAPLVLVPGACLTQPVLAELDRVAPDDLVLLGGQDVVTPAVASGAPCQGPCPTPSRPLERAATPDPRLCLAFELPASSWYAWSRIPATFGVQNRSAQTVDLTHPSGCPLFYGRFDPNDGHFVGQGPEACTAVVTHTRLAPGETRTWRFDLDTGTSDGTWVFAAGLDTTSGVLYARERTVALSAP